MDMCWRSPSNAGIGPHEKAPPNHPMKLTVAFGTRSFSSETGFIRIHVRGPGVDHGGGRLVGGGSGQGDQTWRSPGDGAALYTGVWRARPLQGPAGMLLRSSGAGFQVIAVPWRQWEATNAAARSA
jgi:hypothetical protein